MRVFAVVFVSLLLSTPSFAARCGGDFNTFIAAISAEADLETAGVPIAFQLEYLPSEEWNDAGQGFLAQPSKHTVTAGLYYSGRRNLQLGVLAATTRNLKPVQGLDGERRSGRPHLMFGELSMRYVW